MKLQLTLIVAFGLAAGPAAAFSSGFEPARKPSGGWSSAPWPKKPPSSYGAPLPSSRETAPRRSSPGGFGPIVGPQDPPGARSYKPYTPGSVYSAPSQRTKPACDRSVYASACERKPGSRAP